MKRLIVSFIIFSSSVSFGYNPFEWQSIEIPGAKCGNGDSYSIQYRKGDSKKLFIELMGGGACWSKDTCGLVNLRAWIRPIPFKTPEVVADSERFKDFSGVFLPYCTADVHMGSFEQDYEGRLVYHWGEKNFRLTLKHLKKMGLIQWQELDEFLLWGSSAGAIGAIVYAHEFDQLLRKKTKRTLIADSPGLHFGNTFWQKFPRPMFQAIQKVSRTAGLHISADNGMLAPKMRPVLKKLKLWDIRFLFATKDIAMSKVFGEIEPADYRSLLLSPEGLPAVAGEYPYARTWLVDSYGHSILIFLNLAEMTGYDGKTALDFINKAHFKHNPK